MAPLKNNAGAWVNLKNDAVQDISHSGIKDCFEQGSNSIKRKVILSFGLNIFFDLFFNFLLI